MKFSFSLFFFFAWCCQVFSQIDSSTSHLSGENNIELISKNYQLFIQKMKLLEAGKIDKIRILQMGDSHLQGGVSSSIVRKRFQEKYGNGGRGIVFPYAIAKTNGPKDYVFKSEESWKSTWITHDPKLFKIGVSGIAIKSMNSFGTMVLNLNNNPQETITRGFFVYSFEKDENGQVFINDKVFRPRKDQDFDTVQFSFKQPQNALKMSFSGAPIIVHDYYLENEERGVIYSSFGVAGAMYRDYFRNEFFGKQIGFYDLDLLIISLGTNESYRKSYSKIEFTKSIDSMFQLLKLKLPQTAILITAPGENYFLKNNQPECNTRVQMINQVLREKCEEYGFAMWDLYKVMGNSGGMLRWKEAGLVNKDYLHYLKGGYSLQGQLLFEAIQKSIQHSSR